MSIFENPSFYISIFSSICFVASEILPFIPNTGNGIVHSIFECLSSYDKSKHTDYKLKEEGNETQVIDNINKKLDEVLSRLNVV